MVFARQVRFKASQVLGTNIATEKIKTLQLFKGHYRISLASIHALDDSKLINKPRKTFQNMFGFFFISDVFAPHLHASLRASVSLSKTYFWSVLDSALARYICLAVFLESQSHPSRVNIAQ